MTFRCILFIALFGRLLCAGANPLSEEARRDYKTIEDYIVRSAEKMPEEGYAFHPTPEIRSFGQLLGHIADDQFSFCSTVAGEKKSSEFEKKAPPKTEMIAGLKSAFGYCEGVYSTMQDSWVGQPIRFLGRDRPKLTGLTFNTEHAWEHYGNLVVYMRLKGIVPPSSEKTK